MAYSALTTSQQEENRRDLGGAMRPRHTSALSTKDAGTVDATYGAAEAAVINNNRDRIEEIEQALQDLGLLA